MKNRLLIGVSAFALVASVSIAPQFAVRAAHAQAVPSSGTMLLAQTEEELLELQKQKKKKNRDAQQEESSGQPAQAEEQPRKKKNREQVQEQPAQEQPVQAEEQQPRKKKNREQVQEQPAQEQPVQAEEQQPRKKNRQVEQAEEPAAGEPAADDAGGQPQKRRQQAEEVQPAEQPPAATTTQDQPPAATTTTEPTQAEGDDQQRRKKRNQAAEDTQPPAGETVTQQPGEQPAGEAVTQQPETGQPPATATGAEEGTADGKRKKRREQSVDAEVITPEEQQKAVEEAKQPATVSPEAVKPKDIVADKPVEEIVKKAEREAPAVVSDQITEKQREDLRKAERRRRENVRENRNELLGAAAVGIAIGAAIPLLGGVVAADEGDRIVVERGGEYYVRKDDSALFRYDADDVEYERLRGGRVREIVTRPNGSQIITIRDAGGYVLRRVKITPDGRRYVLFDVREEYYNRPYQPVVLPYYEVELPPEVYVVSARRADRELFYETFEAPPVYETNERYSLRDIRENEQVRSLVRRVDLDTITFETGSAYVTESQVALLGDIAGGMLDVIEKDPAAVFLIEGHTDAVGSEISNMTLSDRRAEAVARILSEAYEVPAENMVVQGYGETYLKVQTDGAERANRRVTLRNITPILQTSSETAEEQQ